MKRKGAGSKQKGASFERDICRALSLWITKGDKSDLFWRSAMSGGRATLYDDVRQGGDIAPVAREGIPFMDHYYVECKFYKDLDFAAFLLEDKGVLSKFWKTAKIEARRLRRQPLLIAKQNMRAAVCLTSINDNHFRHGGEMRIYVRDAYFCLLDDFLKTTPPGGFQDRPRLLKRGK